MLKLCLILKYLFSRPTWHVLTVCPTVNVYFSADDLSSDLCLRGIAVQSLHGDREQCDREEALQDFKDGMLQPTYGLRYVNLILIELGTGSIFRVIRNVAYTIDNSHTANCFQLIMFNLVISRTCAYTSSH